MRRPNVRGFPQVLVHVNVGEPRHARPEAGAVVTLQAVGMVEHDEDKPSALCVQSMPCRHLGLWPGVFWAHMQTHLVAEADRDTNLDPCRAVCGLAPVSKHAQSLGQTDV